MPWTVTDPWKAVGAVAAVVLLNAVLSMTLYVRGINDYGAAAVAMLFTVIPAVAGLLSWVMLGQRPDIGIAVGPGRRRGGLLAQREGFTSAASAFGDLADGLHHAGELSGDIRTGRLIDEFSHATRFVLGDPIPQLRRGPGECELRQQVCRNRDRFLVNRREPHEVALVRSN